MSDLDSTVTHPCWCNHPRSTHTGNHNTGGCFATNNCPCEAYSAKRVHWGDLPGRIPAGMSKPVIEVRRSGQRNPQAFIGGVWCTITPSESGEVEVWS